MSGYNPSETLKQTIILGIYFNLTYTTFLSFSCIITYIAQHQEGQYDYGPLVALATNYSVYLVTLIFSSTIKDFKWQFQMSAICHLINYAVYIPGWKGDLGLIAGIVGAVFGGYGAAIYWVSQGGYMMKLFRTYHIRENEEGKYFGITNGIVYGSSFFGALVTTFGLGYFGSQIYFSILTGLALLSWAVCTVFLDDLKKEAQQGTVKSLLTQNAQSTSIALVQEPPQTPLGQQVKQIFIKTMSYYPKMWYMFTPIIIDGVISGFISTYLNKLIPLPLRTDLNVGYLLMIQGFGCIVGAITSAFLSDKYSVFNVGKAGLAIIFVSICLTFANYQIEFEGLLYPYVVGLCWGFAINYITSWESVSCAKVNKGCLQSFSIVKQGQAITYIIFTIAMIITSNQVNLPIFLLILASLCIVSMISFTIYERNTRKITLLVESTESQ